MLIIYGYLLNYNKMLDYYYFIVKSEDGVAFAEGEAFSSFEEAKTELNKMPNKEDYHIIRCGF